MVEAHALVAPPPGPLDDWGPVASPLGTPVSHTRGRLLWRGPAGWPEAGYWECTPGRWRCEIARDEFCHFLSGRARYEADDGTVLEVGAGTAAVFPKGWRGTCEVIETVAKTYMVA